MNYGFFCFILFSIVTVLYVCFGRDVYILGDETNGLTFNRNDTGEFTSEQHKKENSVTAYSILLPVLAPFIYKMLLSDKPSNQRLLEDVWLEFLSILYLSIWLLLAFLAPFCFCPERMLFAGNVVDPVIQSKRRRRRRLKKFKNKQAETSGPINRRIKTSIMLYTETKKRQRKCKREIIQRIKHIVQAFKAKCHRSQTAMQTRLQLAQQSSRSVKRLQAELVVLEHALCGLSARLESNRNQNKLLVQQYEKIHQQISHLYRAPNIQHCASTAVY